MNKRRTGFPSEMLDEVRRSLRVYVVYDRPIDAPNHFVVRAHYTRMDGSIEASPAWALFDSLEEAREHCASLGLVRLERHRHDDPKIVETWT